MAFNAGSIDATLRLDRNPFTAGIAAARAQARSLARERFVVTVKVDVDRASLNQATRDLQNFTKNSRAATAKVNVDRLSFDKLVVDLRKFGMATYTAKARVDTGNSNQQLSSLINLANRSGSSLSSMGDNGSRAFSRVNGGARILMATLPLVLPLAAVAFTGVIGLVGALTAVFVTAGIGVAAFAAVAIPAFDKIKTAVGAGQKEIDKLPPGLRQAANALKGFNDAYERLQKQTETGVGFALAAGLKAATTAINTLRPLVDATSRAFTIIGEKLDKYFGSPHWQAFVNLMRDNIVPVITKLGDIAGYAAIAVMNLVTAFMPLGQWLLDKLVQGMKDFAHWTEELGKNPEFQRFIQMVKDNLPKVWYLISQVVEFLFRLAMALTPLGGKIAEVLGKIFEGLNKLPPEWLGAIAIGIAGFFAALLIGATGPVGIAVGVIAGLAFLFSDAATNSDSLKGSIDGLATSFKEKLNPILDQIKTGFEEHIIPAWDKFRAAIEEHILPVLKDLWNVFQEKILPALKDLAKIITEQVIPNVLAFYTAIAPIAGWFLEFFGKIFIHLLEGALHILGGILLGMSGVLLFFAGVFTGDWQKMGDGLATISEGFWTVIAGIFGMNLDEMKAKYNEWDAELTTSWRLFWEGRKQDQSLAGSESLTAWETFWTSFDIGADRAMGTIRTKWVEFWGGTLEDQHGGQTTILGSWNEFWNWAQQKYNEWDLALTTGWHNFWQGVADEFTRQRLKIGAEWTSFWAGIANTIRDPINWVISVVLNKGILNGWNTVMGWIGAEGLKANPIPEMPRYAEGGQVYGPGTGTSDSIVARVSKDEYIMPAKRARKHMHFLEALRQGQPEAVQAAGGPNNVNAYPGFAQGGIAAGMNFAKAQQGKPYIWGGVGPGGYDCSGYISAIANALMGFSPYRRIGTTGSAPWPGWSPGLTSAFGVGYFKGNPGHMAGTLSGTNVESGSGHGPEVGGRALGANAGMFGNRHFSLPTVGGTFTAGANFSGSGGGAMVSMWDMFGTKVADLLNGLLNFGDMPSNGSPMGNAITQIPKKIIPIVFEKLKGKLAAMFTSDPNAPSSAGGNAAAGVQQWSGIVNQALGMMGLGTALSGITLRRMNQESGGNPRAINLTDSNARRGTPSKGLMQVIDPTFQSFRDARAPNDIWDPLANILASMHYALARYGSLPAAYNRSGGYGKGGYLDPGESAFNETGRREAIFNDQQLQRMGSPDPESIRELVRAIVAESESTGVKIGTIVLPNGASVKDLAQEVGFSVRQVGKGRYRK
jgi:hypothetical protein